MHWDIWIVLILVGILPMSSGFLEASVVTILEFHTEPFLIHSRQLLFYCSREKKAIFINYSFIFLLICPCDATSACSAGIYYLIKVLKSQ